MFGITLLIVAAALLWIGAELFVEHAASAGKRLGTTALAIGLLLAGAEPEELITAVIAALRDRGGIAAGDAIGANVTMLTLVLGLAALARPLPTSTRVRRYLLGAGGLGIAAALSIPGGVDQVSGAVLVILYVIAVAAVWRSEGKAPPIGELAELEEEEGEEPESSPEGWRGLGLSLLGVAIMATGGWVAVVGAEGVIESLSIEESVVGLSLVALATTAELFALAYSALRRQLGELAVAGVVGSAAYNATMTLGSAAVARPIDTTGILPAAILAASLPFLLVILGIKHGEIRRRGGALLVALYIAYLIWLY